MTSLSDAIVSNENDENQREYITPPTEIKEVRRRVTWADGTAEAPSAHLAVSIPRHKTNKTTKHTLYTLDLYQDGRAWTIKRRYREFCDFHDRLLTEDWIEPSRLPQLPAKRWLEMKRWVDRFDEVYTTRRRLRLQEYIRAIIRIPIIVERSFALQQFLEINKTLLNTPGRHSQEEFSESVDGGRISFFDTINEDE
mmetsp:Transcript_5225/g.5346  ORF Transcript_5225/g.5346 Transcript_5225/m.5346 type:complete len:196 (-) Transcript_5225:290-877(-)